jgi:serine O-acetyltransferase
MSTSKNFSLFSSLRVDMLRHRAMTLGEDVNQIFRPRMWLGVLSPRFMPVLFCRLAFKFNVVGFGLGAKFFTLLNFIVFGIEIAPQCSIGPGLFLPHTQGTVIGAWSIGSNVTIFQGVTLGAREIHFLYKEEIRPKVSDNVSIGAGAKVLGGIVIGTNARIGANAVVLKNVPEDCFAVGVPARILKNDKVDGL